MSQLGELLNKLAIQSGVDANDESLKALLSNPTISSYEVPATIVNSISSNMLTIESAKSNPVLKSHFYALAYNGLDSELENLATEFGVESSIMEELKAEKSSTKRAAQFTRKIKELESLKAKASGSDKNGLQTEIDRLNGELKTIKEGHSQELSKTQASFRESIKNMLSDNLLMGYEYSLPVDKSIAVSTAKQLIDMELRKVGGNLVLNDNNELELKNKDGMDLFIGNDKFDYKSFVDQSLATHKLLKTKDATPPAPVIPPSNAPAGMGEFLAQATKNAEQFG